MAVGVWVGAAAIFSPSVAATECKCMSTVFGADLSRALHSCRQQWLVISKERVGRTAPSFLLNIKQHTKIASWSHSEDMLQSVKTQRVLSDQMSGVCLDWQKKGMPGARRRVSNWLYIKRSLIFPSENSSGSISSCLDHVSGKIASHFSCAVERPTLMEDLVCD